MPANLIDAAKAIIRARDYGAEHGGEYDPADFHPGEDQCFDDWAADLLETALSAPMQIEIATIDHRHGTNGYVAVTREALDSKVAEFCVEWWDERADRQAPADPAGMSDADVIAAYFDGNEREFLTYSVDTL